MATVLQVATPEGGSGKILTSAAEWGQIYFLSMSFLIKIVAIQLRQPK